MVCAVSQVQQPGDYLCGTLGDVRYLVVRGADGQLRAFHNVSAHVTDMSLVQSMCAAVHHRSASSALQ